MNQTFGKEYKLCRRKLIDGVFKTGKVVKQYPFVVHFLEVDEKLEAPFQVTISAPKRNFRKAHDRNRIKRLMRETIRFNKMILEDKISKSQKNIIMFMVYTSKEEIPFTTLMKKNELLFEQITKHIE
jgi:ribonuclease P protein component